jgi:hypothetical protein
MPDVASNTPSYWRHMGHLAPAAILGIVLGVLLLDAATWIQALRPGSRPDLKFPSGGLLGARRHQLPRQGFFSRQLTRLSNALVDQVPPSIGAGYIDYATRRVLPGHAFAFALATITCAAYAAGYVALNPAWSSLAGRFPSIAYVLLLLIAGGWLLAAAGFFLDRYRLSTLVVIGVWLLITLSIANTDHYFPVGPAQATAVAPRDALRSAQARNPEQRERIVVVMSEGLGVMSSAWTAEVLARLARHDVIGDRFTRSIRLLSASSGASLGTLHFVNGYASDGFRRDRLGTMTADAASPSSGEGAWGIAYPDLLRPWLPLVVPKYVDRGWAMEQAWKRALGDPEPKLADWQRDTAEGWRPATAFGVTVVESGEHALLATYRTGRHDVTAGLDVSMVTAARLSAAFPFVSPPARGDLRSDQGTEASFHLLDSGMSDNSGWTAVRDWLEAVHDDLHDVNVMIVDIRSLPPRRASAPTEDNAWTLELTAPLRALLEVRLARHEGVSREIEAFNRWWQATHERPLQHVTFALGETAAPLTWNLGRADAGRLQRALQRNEPSVSRVCAFLNGDEPCHK